MTDAIDGKDNDVNGTADVNDDVDDTAGADRDDVGGGDDDDEPARQQADGIDTRVKGRQAEPEPVEPVVRVERGEPGNTLSMRHRRPRVSLTLNPGYSEARYSEAPRLRRLR